MGRESSRVSWPISDDRLTVFPGAYTLANLLPFISLGWLLIGAIAAGILRARRPVTFQALGRAVAPNLDRQLEPD